MSSLVSDAPDDVLVKEMFDRGAFERAWNGIADTTQRSTSKINCAQLTVTRNAARDFQDRQVFLYVDGECWGKVRYNKPLSREIPPGRHQVRAFNTLFSHTIDVDARPGEHVRLKCTNGLGRGGWLMMVIWQVAALSVRLERES
jgi:hypothetical protein